MSHSLLASSKAFSVLGAVNYFVCFKYLIIYKASAISLLFSPGLLHLCAEDSCPGAVGRTALAGEGSGTQVQSCSQQGRGPILQAWGWPPG